ncbi:MAG TPA: extracellular solute-binding protein [bacterium]|nr:extracellular solute-binding protein [bacterium]
MRIPLLIVMVIWLCEASAFPQTRELTVWHPYHGVEEKALHEIAALFSSQRSGISVRLIALPTDQFATLFDEAWARRDLPDALIFDHEKSGAWAAAGRIVPLPKYFADHIAGLTLPTALESLRHEGRSWGIPLSVSTMLLFRRTDMIANPPATTDELISAARSWVGNDTERFGLAFDNRSVAILSAFFSGFGGGLCMSGPIVAEHPCLDSAENAAALAFLAELVNERLLSPDATLSQATRWFIDGRVPFVIADQSFGAALPAATPFSASPLPTVSATGLPMRTPLQVKALYLINAPHTDLPATMRFGEFLASTRGAHLRATRSGQTIATLLAYDEVELHDDPFFNLVRQQAEKAEPLSARADMPLLIEPLRNALRAVLEFDRPPREALAAAFTEYDEALHPPSLQRRIGLSALVLFLLFLPALIFSRLLKRRD